MAGINGNFNFKQQSIQQASQNEFQINDSVDGKNEKTNELKVKTNIVVFGKNGKTVGSTYIDDGKDVTIRLYPDGTKVILDWDRNQKTTVRPDGYQKTEKIEK